MQTSRYRSSILILVLTLGPTTTLASGDNGHNTHRNHVAVFTGFTGEVRRERSFSLGVDYQRQITDSIAIGGLIEKASGDRDFWIAAIPLSWHKGHWRFTIAPGIENEEGHGHHGLIRLSADYSINIDGFSIAPLAAIDFVDGDRVLVIGVSIGKGF